MLAEIPYDGSKSVEYAKKWALGRNPVYLSFDGMGGDCTNFASQCLFAGCGVMNYTPTYGWYYNSPRDRSPSWSGVSFLYNFLTGNRSVGPYAQEVGLSDLRPGDLIQLGDSQGRFYHTPVVVAADENGVFVAAHTFDALMRPLNSYFYSRIRCLRILGARRWQ